ncbi:hypothetical protein [Microtetraspora glauca]|uniref:Zinc-binding dehydrogenase n=1 Tax=Microtetraspora glauca TaxID=1996 RepID=A0ABV3GDY1_MICGL
MGRAGPRGRRAAAVRRRGLLPIHERDVAAVAVRALLAPGDRVLGLTAWQAVFEHARIGRDSRVLINLVADVPASVTRLAKEFVSITQPIEHPRAVQFVARNDPGQLAELVALIDKGVVHVEADVRPLESLADLHRAAERGLIRGKAIVEVEA